MYLVLDNNNLLPEAAALPSADCNAKSWCCLHLAALEDHLEDQLENHLHLHLAALERNLGTNVSQLDGWLELSGLAPHLRRQLGSRV